MASRLSGQSSGDRDRWNEPAAADRVAPRECIRNAQDEMNKAWCSSSYDEAVLWIRSSVDWLRRALEQMT